MLSKVTSLSLAENTLSGTIPSNFQSLEELAVLTMSNNLLSGSVASMFVFPKLRELSIGSNFFNGTISSTIGLISDVELLDLSNNRLSGSLPSDIGLLSKLGKLYCSVECMKLILQSWSDFVKTHFKI